MIVRALVSIAAVAAAVSSFASAWAAAGALAVARVAVLLSYDVPRSRTRWDGASRPREVVTAALPLGFVLMLIALTANVPRYAIEANLGTREVGVFAAVASFATTGSAMVNALGQSAVTRLARLFEAGDRAAFRRLAGRVVLLAGGLGITGVVLALAGGPWFLRSIYRPEYSAHAPLLVAVLVAAAPAYAAQMAGYVTTSTRAFGAQMPLLAVVAAVCATVSFAVVPVLGLYGAAVALGAAALVQLAGQLWIIREKLQWNA
jgi:O-antigen/teichoic acid export membrane protein